MGLSKPFHLGHIVFTQSALISIDNADAWEALVRHTRGDWGNISKRDAIANDDAISYGGRVLSKYCDRRGATFWISTDAERTATTVLLPDEY